MGTILVVNAGSTSLKLHAVEDDRKSTRVESFEDAPARIEAVAHRVVHGGPRFLDPVVIDKEVREQIRELVTLAPLHNAPALEAIDAAQRALPQVPHVAVFDTWFHRTIPAEAAEYAVPPVWSERWGIRRYGFQGLSVDWCAQRVPELLGHVADRLVVCHLGGGSSVTAVVAGRSVDTTMGFTPLEGVPMTTRSGSVDPGALLYLLRAGHFDVDSLDHALNFDSGVSGLAGAGGGMIEIERRARLRGCAGGPSPRGNAASSRSGRCGDGCVRRRARCPCVHRGDRGGVGVSTRRTVRPSPLSRCRPRLEEERECRARLRHCHDELRCQDSGRTRTRRADRSTCCPRAAGLRRRSGLTGRFSVVDRPGDEHRTVRLLDDLRRDAPEQGAFRRSESTGADDDQIDIAASRKIEDHLSGRSFEQLGLVLDVALYGIRGRLRERSPHGAEILAQRALVVRVAQHMQRRVRDTDEGDARAKELREPDAFFGSRQRSGRSVRGDQEAIAAFRALHGRLLSSNRSEGALGAGSRHRGDAGLRCGQPAAGLRLQADVAIPTLGKAWREWQPLLLWMRQHKPSRTSSFATGRPCGSVRRKSRMRIRCSTSFAASPTRASTFGSTVIRAWTSASSSRCWSPTGSNGARYSARMTIVSSRWRVTCVCVTRTQPKLRSPSGMSFRGAASRPVCSNGSPRSQRVSASRSFLPRSWVTTFRCFGFSETLASSRPVSSSRGRPRYGCGLMRQSRCAIESTSETTSP